MIKHIDLFSGIGGFALAADRVWGDVEHTFVEIDPFCQQVLRKHWKGSLLYDDIRTFTYSDWTGSRTPARKTNANWQEIHKEYAKQSQSESSRQNNASENSQCERCSYGKPEKERTEVWQQRQSGSGNENRVYLLTGGFPCQPFSVAGKRKGTEDNRYLWGEMFRVIHEFQPTWIIAENVRGLLTWSEGLVFEQVCLDLEAEGYEVQPFIIPACSVNAPHRRERIWFIANRSDSGDESLRKPQDSLLRYPEWDRDWREVALATCNVRVDDGISAGLDKFGGFTGARHRTERLKALGNSIVPQVAEQIMLSML